MIYNPNDLNSVESFWEGSRIEHQGKVIGMSHHLKKLALSNSEMTKDALVIHEQLMDEYSEAFEKLAQ